MRQKATQIANETSVGGNTAERVGGLFNDVVDKLEEHEDDIDSLGRVEITYKQCQIPNKYINNTNVGNVLNLQSNNDYAVFYFLLRKGQTFAISSTYVAPAASRIYVFYLNETIDTVKRYASVSVGVSQYTADEDCVIVGTLYGNDSVAYTGIQKGYIVNGKLNEVGLTGANIMQFVQEMDETITAQLDVLSQDVEALKTDVFGENLTETLPLPNDGVLNANGTVSLYSDWYNSDYYAVDAEKQYTQKGSIYGGGNILYYDAAKNLLGACGNIPSAYSDRTNEIALDDMPINTAFIRVSGYLVQSCTIKATDSLRDKVEELESRINDVVQTKGIIRELYGATSSNPLRIKLLGDSITQGWGGSNFDQDGAEIYPLGEGWQTHRNLHGYCWANLMRDYLESKYHCTVVNNAITGTSTRNIVNRLDSFIDAADDIVICAYGTNNRNDYDGQGTEWSAFVPNLLSIVNYCKNNGKKIILIANIPASATNESSTDSGHPKRAHMEDVHDAVCYVAESTGVEVVDMFDAWADYCIEKGITFSELPNLLTADGLHPNDNGYGVYYSLIMPRLGVALPLTTIESLEDVQ
jgi:lysophospholipase L1-like esterase